MRSVFYVSDSTAMTSKGLGKSLLSQFENLLLVEHLRPYIDTPERVNDLIAELKYAERIDGHRPIVFATMMDDNLMKRLHYEIEDVIDIFAPFLANLENVLNKKSSKQVGRAHTASMQRYTQRTEAIDFTMATDDGLRTYDYDKADIILLGVSRSGKTPTALYLALNFGLKVANFPFTADDLPEYSLHEAHKKNHHKLIGLIVNAERLTTVRKERRPQSSYADEKQVKLELAALRALYVKENIPIIDTTIRSVEEIAASIMRRLS